MAYQGQRYEPDDFGYPGSRHGDRERYQQQGQQQQNSQHPQQNGANHGPPSRAGRKADPAVVERCLNELKRACKARGVSGIKTMGRMFRLYDDNRSGTLTQQEFTNGLRDYGLTFTGEEMRHLFNNFDTDNNGTVNYNEFLKALRPPMSQARIDLIEKAFQKLDKTGDGIVTVDDLKKVYNVTYHPKYKSGEWTKKQVLEEYLRSFEVGANAERDSKVTKQEFIEYYAGVSASIDKDVYFDYMMRQCWHI